MQEDIFREHLVKATGHSFKFAKKFVRNHLPESFLYIVHLNQSCDGDLRPGEQVFPDDVARHGAQIGPLSVDQVVELLWRDGTVPEWIDISVTDANDDSTFMQLLCCGRFTDHEEYLYYPDGGITPFGCKSPRLPPRWSESDGPFDLHWQIDRKS